MFPESKSAGQKDNTSNIKQSKQMKTSFMDEIWSNLRQYWGTLLWTVKALALVIFMTYIAVPIFIRANPWIVPKVIFSNVVRWPPFIDLSRPADFGLNTTRNLYLTVDNGVQLGSWHILPKSLEHRIDPLDPYVYEDLLAAGNKIMVYLHGNSGTRGGWHRVQMYKLLASLDFHVVTIDYRGFGDSSGSPSEDGVVSDAYFLYKWVRERSGSSPVFLWGHSLGTAITTKLAKKLCHEGEPPLGVVLEAPFNNIREAAENHPFSFPYRLLPWFSWIFIDTIKENGIFFNSDENIEHVTPPILILHAEDDAIVPLHLGKKLYHAAKESRQDHHGDVEFQVFDGDDGFGHKHIFKSPNLPGIIQNFVDKSIGKKKN
ncbi:lysophosphatidylserine lipase ABHD12-like [Gigantopelta aegis]|uniref:lysophosphatidylserine lipase ABHD12-like n=1 Tax=Gigantopelta aegis TaxID=1735272 RepID=UPI001B88DA45|nr:lysophosphatidylserine lipase ABHD12-like [Gigantopelta aegis]